MHKGERTPGDKESRCAGQRLLYEVVGIRGWPLQLLLSRSGLCIALLIDKHLAAINHLAHLIHTNLQPGMFGV